MQLTDDPTRSEQNPVLFTAPTGQLWLLYTAQLAGNQDTAEVRRRVSDDGGRTWGPVETLFPATDTRRRVRPAAARRAASGRWLLPIFRCVTVPGEKWVGNADTSAVMISDDGGATWPRHVRAGQHRLRAHEHPSAGRTARCWPCSAAAGPTTIYRDPVHRRRRRPGASPRPTELPNNNSSIQFSGAGRRPAGAGLQPQPRGWTPPSAGLSLYDEIDDEGLAERRQATSPPIRPSRPPPVDCD